MHWIDRVKNVDRRIIYLLVLIAASVPLLKPLDLPIDISPDAQRIYDHLDSLSSGSLVMMSFDYDAGSRAEVHPMAEAVAEHCISRGLKILAPALWTQGPSMANELFSKMQKVHPDLVYGRDYVTLGYFVGPTQGDPQVKALMSDLVSAYPRDTRGNQTKDLPIMQNLHSSLDLKLVLSLSAGDPGISAWVRQGADEYHVTLAGGSTAIQTPSLLPFVDSGQMLGILGGLKGAAEYEKLMKKPGLGTSGMDAQSVVHLVIIVFILLANSVYAYEKFILKRI